MPKKTLSKPKKSTKKTKVASPKGLVDQYRTHGQDTGSPEVQVALITQRIQKLADHLRIHAKDYDSKRGLLMLVGKRRRLLNYIARHNNDRYQSLIADLGLRK